MRVEEVGREVEAYSPLARFLRYMFLYYLGVGKKVAVVDFCFLRTWSWSPYSVYLMVGWLILGCLAFCLGGLLAVERNLKRERKRGWYFWLGSRFARFSCILGAFSAWFLGWERVGQDGEGI